MLTKNTQAADKAFTKAVQAADDARWAAKAKADSDWCQAIRAADRAFVAADIAYTDSYSDFIANNSTKVI